MGSLDGRVAIITGAGRGIGREHALLFAQEGARVVVNDLGVANDGHGFDDSPARQVADEIVASGGTAIANVDNVATWAGTARMVDQAIDEFGSLDIVVNNAGILRDAFITDMTEKQWDDVISVHLKGHAGLIHHAAAYWKSQAKAGKSNRGSVINTASGSGSTAIIPRETNYGSAKAGILAMTQVAALELARFDARVNAIAPLSRTRLTEFTPGVQERVARPNGGFDPHHPAQISPMVAYLASTECALTGRVFAVRGGLIEELAGWRVVQAFESHQPWTVEQIHAMDWATPTQRASRI